MLSYSSLSTPKIEYSEYTPVWIRVQNLYKNATLHTARNLVLTRYSRFFVVFRGFLSFDKHSSSVKRERELCRRDGMYDGA